MVVGPFGHGCKTTGSEGTCFYLPTVRALGVRKTLLFI